MKNLPRSTDETKKEIDYKSISRDARSFMKNNDSGVLSTILKDHEGCPFGSICPYVVSEEGEIIILTSDIAIHTKNMNDNPRVAFTVFDMTSKNKLASSRVSISGKATKIDSESNSKKLENISSLYLKFFPEAKSYFKAHKFDFFAIKPELVHYIKTFGSIYTFSATENWDIPKAQWNSGQGEFAIDHMNKDHQSSLHDYAKKFLDMEAKEIELISVDVEGFHMKVDEEVKYLNFYQDATADDSLRKEFVALIRK
tara:strand:+ start:6733 stop:7497 length:765 start_codon:yes stop_codon:yes gene_type:complete